MTETMYQCIGCGAVIQTEDQNQLGYLPASAFEKGKESGEFYCQRCFRLRHYNELTDLEIDENVFLDRLHEISSNNAYIIHVIDVFDIEGSIIHGLSRFTAGSPFSVVVNKFDLLPKATKIGRVRQRITETIHREGLFPEEVIVLSATKQPTIEPLTTLIEREVRRRNVYIVGVTNVGKSTLMNQLISYYGGETNIITTSNHPGTTLDLIEVPVNHHHAIIDTPGIMRDHQMTYYLSRSSIQEILPTKPMRPQTFQLNPDQTIFFGGLARMDFVDGERTAFTIYASRDLYLHRTKTERADEFYQKHVGDLLSPPYQDVDEHLPDFVERTIHLNPQEDVAISGLGWFTVNEAISIKLFVPKGIKISVRPRLI